MIAGLSAGAVGAFGDCRKNWRGALKHSLGKGRDVRHPAMHRAVPENHLTFQKTEECSVAQL